MTTNRLAASRHLHLCIGGVGIELRSENGELAGESVLDFYEEFLSEGESEVQLTITCGEPPPVEAADTVFAAEENRWRLSRRNGSHLFEIFDTKPPHRQVQLAILEDRFSSGHVYVKPVGRSRRPQWSLANLMRPLGELLLIQRLSQGRGVAVHALGINDRGRGLVFLGRSGSGKTTLANLYKGQPGVTILSDERIVLRQIDGEFFVSGTPWPGGGFMVSAETVPITQIFFLHHAPANALEAEDAMTGCSLLLQQTFLPFWNRDALAFALRFGEELLGSVPAHRLGFVNDASVIEFLREVT